MQIASTISDPDLPSALGGALLHALWQGFVAYCVYRVARLISARASIRYVIGNVCLATLLFAQLATFAYCIAVNLNADWLDALPLIGTAPPDEASRATAWGTLRMVPLPRESFWSYLTELSRPYQPYVFGAWACGLLITGVRTAGAMLLLDRCIRRCPNLVGPWVVQAREAARRLPLPRPVRFLECARVSVPATAGWLKPVVLFPPAHLLNLLPAHLEALVLHELAHIARHDYIAAVARSWVRSIYFFHPGVRSIVKSLDADAEEAADELAARALGDRKIYFEAVIRLDECRPNVAGLLGADGGSLKSRLLNLIADRGAPGRQALRLSAVAPFLALMLLFSTLGQSYTSAATARSAFALAQAQTFTQSVLADFTQQGTGTEAETLLARAVHEARANGHANDVTLAEFADAILEGIAPDLLIAPAAPGVEALRDLDPGVVARFGSFVEREALVARLRELASLHPKGPDRRRLARAALCLASLDMVSRSGVAATTMLADRQFRSSLQLSSSQRRKLDIAVSVHNDRIGRISRLMTACRVPTFRASGDDVRQAIELLALMPGMQRAAAMTLCKPVRDDILAELARQPEATPKLGRLVTLLAGARDRPDAYIGAPLAIYRGPVEVKLPRDAVAMPTRR